MFIMIITNILTVFLLLFKYYIHLLIYELLQLSTKLNTDLSVVDNASFLNTGMLFQHTAQYINICFDISINNKIP